MTFQKNSKILKKVYNFLFLVIAVILCLDFGYIKRKTKVIQYFVKIMNTFQVTVVLFGLYFYSRFLVDTDVLTSLWYITNNIQYLTCFFVLHLCNKENSFFTFQDNLYLIDKKLGFFVYAYNIEIKFIVSYLIVICYEVGVVIYFCIYFKQYCRAPYYWLFFFNCPMFSADALLIVYTCLFYSVFCRMKAFTNLVANCTNNYCFCYNVYTDLADVTDKVRNIFSCMFFCCLIFYMSDTMLTVFFPLTIINSMEGLQDYISANVTVIPTLLIIFAPAMTASLLTSQVDKLKLMLYDRLIHDRDKDNYVALQKFVRYIEARPFKFKIAGIIPMDWSLVAIVLNVMVTYIIILLQMTPKAFNND